MAVTNKDFIVKNKLIIHGITSSGILAVDSTGQVTSTSPGIAGQLLMSYGPDPALGGPQWVSFQLKEQVTAATTVSISGTYANNTPGVTPSRLTLKNTGSWTVDGITLSIDDRVLIKDQVIYTIPDYTANGVYIVVDDGISTGTSGYVILDRDNDVDTADKLASMIIPVGDGTINGGTIWASAFRASYVLGTDPILFNTMSNSKQPDLEQIVPIDNIEKSFDGRENRFELTYQGEVFPISNQFRLLVTLNGVTQPMGNPDYVYQTVFGYEFCYIDEDGYLVFPEPVPAGSQFNARYMAGPDISTVTTYYPFDAMDIMVGSGA
jgi:hypothetical protein